MTRTTSDVPYVDHKRKNFISDGVFTAGLCSVENLNESSLNVLLLECRVLSLYVSQCF